MSGQQGSRLRSFLRSKLGFVVVALALVGMLGVGYKGYRWLRSPPKPIAIPTERMLVQAAMAARPNDPWPRGKAHVVLARPGTAEADKSYHELGGSFSPQVGSFGVSVWGVAASGELRITSDALAPAEVTQSLVSRPPGPPALHTRTPYYEATWTVGPRNEKTLALTPKQSDSMRLAIVVRSVGPAGGPVHDLVHEGTRLIVNGRWTLSFSRAPHEVRLGEEPSAPGESMLAPERSTVSDGASRRAHSDSGWAYARVAFEGPAPIEVTLDDAWPRPVARLEETDFSRRISAVVPDPRFAESLSAQVDHLLMSLVRSETRPGDPTSYPLAWLRDGAYAVVALARAGKLEVARELMTTFAERDFFGGFGAEADGPPLSLWAIEEVARASSDPAVDRWVYPHVHRKAEMIGRMMSTDRPIDARPVVGPIVPSWKDRADLARVCDSSRDGLIIGRMDGHYPLLFVNSVSFLALRKAAAIAQRVGASSDHQRFSKRAATLKRAWSGAFKTSERENERTAISTLWPSYVGAGHEADFRTLLEARWKSLRTPEGGFQKSPREWTYFDIAEAHQWLLLGDPDRVWKTLDYYFKHQASPGLYTWSEGSGEENNFGLWEGVRGWIAPQHVTPHYWTASEMLLLQLAMLAYVDESTDSPGWVIGAGVKKEWLDQPMSAANVGTALGSVDWSYTPGESRRVVVTIRGPRAAVRLGPSFPPDVQVHTTFIDEIRSPPSSEP